MTDMHVETIPYGRGEVTLRIPRRNYVGTLFPTYRSGVEDETGEILRALSYPLGTPALREIAANKKGKKTVVVVNDASRPTATHKLLPPLMKELEACGIPDQDILILIATGTHRAVRPDEFNRLLGEGMAGRDRIVNHDCLDLKNMVRLGTTSEGIPVILNLVQNQRKEITRAVAGDLEEAWLAGVEASREVFEIEAPENVDIVIAVPGGHPRDFNLYQSQKALATAELVVKKGGSIILPVECRDGVGSELFLEWMSSASCPEDVMERFRVEGYNAGTSKAWLYARCLLKAEVIVVSDCLDEETLGRMVTNKAPDLDKAVATALEAQGQDAGILVLRNAPDMIPKRRQAVFFEGGKFKVQEHS